jgi:pyruvate-ferredoxin/flavodoxin oxidoreductase
VRIAVVDPFPASDLEQALRTASSVTILDRAGATGEELVERVKGCLPSGGTSGRRPGSPEQRVFRASLGSGSTLSSGEAKALFGNMSGDPLTAESFEVGVQFASPEARTPSLQSLHQSLKRSFPEIERSGLAPDLSGTTDRSHPSLLLAGSDRTAAARVSDALARASYTVFKLPAATARLDCPRQGNASVVSFGAVSPAEAGVNPIRVILSTNLEIVAGTLDQVLVDRGVAVVASGSAVQRTSDRLLERLVSQGLDVYAVELASTLPDPVEMAILAAAWLTRQEQFSDSSEKLLSAFLTTLSDDMGWSQDEQALAANLAAAPPPLVRLGPDDKVPPAPERPAPRKVKEAIERPGDLADVGRWWKTVGYALEYDEFDLVSPDPYLSSGVLPARSAVIQTPSKTAEALPQVAPENCTGCNACAAFCPEGAVRTAARSVQELIDYGVERVSKLGKSTIQLERASRALAKQAHRTISRDKLRQFRTVGEVLNLALEPVLEAMKPAEETKLELLDGFEGLVDCIGMLPIIRTERFFDEPENQQKGSGTLFLLAVRPDACTSCGICVTACGDDALDMRRMKVDLAEAYESASTTVEELQSPWVARNDSDVMRFVMGRRAADAVSTCVSDSGGSGLKMAVRLICALIEDEWSPRYSQLAAESRELADEIRTRIKEKLQASVEVNDFEMFRKRLDSLPSRSLSGTELFGLIDEISGQSVDTSLLSKLTSSLGDLEALWTKLETGRTGEGRARMAAVFGSGSQLESDRTFPYNPYPFPWIHVRQGSPVSMAEGLTAGLAREMADTFSVLRNARRLANGLDPDPAAGTLTWDQFTDDERHVCPPICVFTQDDSDIDDSWLDSGFPVKLFVLDGLDGFAQGRLEDRLRPLYRPHSFVLHSTPASFEHFASGIREGLSYQGAAVFRIYAPVPDVHGFPFSQTLDRMSAAVATRSFPLLKYAPGPDREWQDRWSLEGNEKPGEDWVSESRLPVSWMAGERRFRGLFDPGSPEEVIREVPLLELLENGSDDDSEARVTATLAVEDRSLKVGLRPAAVDATRQALGFWRLLQELAGIRSTALDQARREARRELEQQLADSRSRIEAEAREEIRLIENRHQSIYHEKLKNRLLQLSGYVPGSEEYEKRLTESVTGEE